MDKQTATCLQYMLVTCQREGRPICAAAWMFGTVWRMIYDSHDPSSNGWSFSKQESKQHAADRRTIRQQTSSSQSPQHPPEKTEGVRVWAEDIKLVLTTSCRICWGSTSHAGVLDGGSWAGQSVLHEWVSRCLLPMVTFCLFSRACFYRQDVLLFSACT